MGEFFIMVWLFQSSAPGVEETRFINTTSYSAGPFTSSGCLNAQKAVHLLADKTRMTAVSLCVPKDIPTAKLKVEEPSKLAPKEADK